DRRCRAGAAPRFDGERRAGALQPGTDTEQTESTRVRTRPRNDAGVKATSVVDDLDANRLSAGFENYFHSRGRGMFRGVDEKFANDLAEHPAQVVSQPRRRLL